MAKGGGEVKALSLWQPWASLLVHGLKRVETRGAYFARPLARLIGKGPLLIHAAAKWSYEQSQYAHSGPFYRALELIGQQPQGRRPVDSMPLGAVIGCVNVRAILPTDKVQWMPNHNRYFGCDGYSGTVVVGSWEKAFGDYSDGRIAIVTDEPRAFRKPVPLPGRQSIFQVPDAMVQTGLAFAVGQEHWTPDRASPPAGDPTSGDEVSTDGRKDSDR